MYVADTGNSRIQKFDANGTFLTKWGSFGNADGRFNGPIGIDTDAIGNVYVADSGNNRVQKFDSAGNFVLKFGSTGTGNSHSWDPRMSQSTLWGRVRDRQLQLPGEEVHADRAHS